MSKSYMSIDLWPLRGNEGPKNAKLLTVSTGATVTTAAAFEGDGGPLSSRQGLWRGLRVPPIPPQNRRPRRDKYIPDSRDRNSRSMPFEGDEDKTLVRFEAVPGT